MRSSSISMHTPSFLDLVEKDASIRGICASGCEMVCV